MLTAFATNIRNGTRLALFREVSFEDFTVDWAQLIGLLLVGYLIGIGFQYVMTALEPVDQASIWTMQIADSLGLVLGAVAVCLIQGAPDRTTGLLVVILAATTVLLAVVLLVFGLVTASGAPVPMAPETPDAEAAAGFAGTAVTTIVSIVGLGLLLVASFRSIRCVFPVGQGRALLLLIVLMVVGSIPGLALEAVR